MFDFIVSNRTQPLREDIQEVKEQTQRIEKDILEVAKDIVRLKSKLEQNGGQHTDLLSPTPPTNHATTLMYP